jgi:RNA polymerase sigma-70 factor (ECF subfamily)
MNTTLFPARAFQTAYEEYYDRVYDYVYRILLHRQDAEDVVSETFLKAMDAWRQYDPERASLSTWLYAIARNCAYNYARAAGRRAVSLESLREDGALPEPAEDPWQAGSAEERVWEILRELSAQERGFLSMRYGMGMSNREVAEALGVSEAAAAKRYARLLDKCRKIAGKR